MSRVGFYWYSPTSLLALSFFVFFVSIFFPPVVYQYYIGEPYSAFMDMKAFIFVVLCCVVFALGARFGDRLFVVKFNRIYLTRAHIFIPLVFSTVLGLVSFVIIVSKNPWMLTAWFKDASSVKLGFNTDGGLSEAQPLLFATVWWAILRLRQKEVRENSIDYNLRLCVAVALFVSVMLAIIKVARYDLMPIIVGVIISFGLFKEHSAVRAILVVLGLSFVVVSVFAVFSLLRDDVYFDDVVASFIGYIISPFNRLSYLLDGQLDMIYAGTGTYTVRFLGSIPLLHNLIDLQSYFALPDSYDVWLSEFDSMMNAGLDARFIWITVFGYLYAELGYFVYIYLFVLGVFTAVLWKLLLSNFAFGIVLYPWFAFCTLFWFGSNYLVYPRLITFIVLGAILHVYEKIVSR